MQEIANALDLHRSVLPSADASLFLVKDVASEAQHNFSLSRSVDRAHEGGMLAGYKVHATKNVKPEPAQIKGTVMTEFGCVCKKMM